MKRNIRKIESTLLKKVYQTDIKSITELGYILDNANKLIEKNKNKSKQLIRFMSYKLGQLFSFLLML